MELPIYKVLSQRFNEGVRTTRRAVWLDWGGLVLPSNGSFVSRYHGH